MPKLLHAPVPKFYLHSKTRETTSIILSLVMPWKGKMHRFKYHSGLTIKVSQWDPVKQRPKIIGKNHAALAKLSEQINELEKICIEILNENKSNTSPVRLKNELDIRRGFKQKKEAPGASKAVIPPFLEFLDLYLEERRNAATYKRGTHKVLETWVTHLKNFSAEQKRPLEYQDINTMFLQIFKDWLCDPKRNLSSNYIAKGVTVIKQFMLEAKRRKYHSSEDFFEFKHQKEKVVKVSLSFQELEAIYKLDLSNNPKLVKVRDLFLIGAYTGLRFSDFVSIRPEHIKEEDGKRYLTLYTQKTATPVTIPLLAIPEEILKKYGYATPKLSNQKLNAGLKELGALANLDSTIVDVRTKGGKRVDQTWNKWERLSSHAARRSFATNFFLQGIPAGVLMQITGHSTEKQFMQYINVDPKANAVRFADLVQGKDFSG